VSSARSTREVFASFQYVCVPSTQELAWPWEWCNRFGVLGVSTKCRIPPRGYGLFRGPPHTITRLRRIFSICSKENCVRCRRLQLQNSRTLVNVPARDFRTSTQVPLDNGVAATPAWRLATGAESDVENVHDVAEHAARGNRSDCGSGCGENRRSHLVIATVFGGNRYEIPAHVRITG